MYVIIDSDDQNNNARNLIIQENQNLFSWKIFDLIIAVLHKCEYQKISVINVLWVVYSIQFVLLTVRQFQQVKGGM